MSALTYQTRHGVKAVLALFPATEAKTNFGALLDQVQKDGAIAITRHDAPRAVLLSLDEFEALQARSESTLAKLTAEFQGLFDEMQTDKAKAGVKAAFAATPHELGAAALSVAGAGSQSKAAPRAKAKAKR
jgi:antitoxin Phd